MANRASRRAKRQTENLATGLAALAILGALAPDNRSPSPETVGDRAVHEGQKIAARLVLNSHDPDVQQSVIDEILAKSIGVEEVGTLVAALKYVTTGYLSSALDRLDELEDGHSDTTREDIYALAGEMIAKVDGQ